MLVLFNKNYIAFTFSFDMASTIGTLVISKKLNACSFRHIPNPNLSDHILIASNIQNFVLSVTSSTSIITFNGSILFSFIFVCVLIIKS